MTADSHTTGSVTADRTPIHTRTVTYSSHARPDGRFDIECRIEDRRHFPFKPLEGPVKDADTPFHGIGVTLTVDETLCVTGIAAWLTATPFPECHGAVTPLQSLVGLRLGRGWRQAVDGVLSRSASCTHMREMLYAVPSAAIQAIPSYRALQAGDRWPPPINDSQSRPHFIGGCVSWRQDGDVVRRHFPALHRKDA